MKALEALDDLMSVYFDDNQAKRKHGMTEEAAREKAEVVRKELKALELIREMRSYKDDEAIAKIISDVEESEDFEEFSVGYPLFSKEEYDLLKLVSK